jgi:micrococcal nuclease
MYEYKAECLRVVDGDTIDARIDLGFDTWKKVRIRFYGINTPESRTRDLEAKKRGKAATKCLGELFVETLGDVAIHTQLINEGHGVAYFGGKR